MTIMREGALLTTSCGHLVTLQSGLFAALAYNVKQATYRPDRHPTPNGADRGVGDTTLETTIRVYQNSYEIPMAINV
jgi:hypothetical protein